jgi:hypothetical protein
MTQSSGAIVPSPSTSERRKLLRDVLPLSLITSYAHVDLLGAASVDLPQQAGIPCLAVAVATAIEQQVGIQPSTSTWSATQSSSGCSRRPAEPITIRERGREAFRAQHQAPSHFRLGTGSTPPNATPGESET